MSTYACELITGKADVDYSSKILNGSNVASIWGEWK